MVPATLHTLVMRVWASCWVMNAFLAHTQRTKPHEMFWNGPGNGSVDVRLSHHEIDGSKGDDSPTEKLLA